MVAMTLLPRSRPLTRADLDAIPDDGHRYELLDGVLLVTPAPSLEHQRVARELFLLLHAACPEGLEVLFAPFDVVLADDTVLQPERSRYEAAGTASYWVADPTDLTLTAWDVHEGRYVEVASVSGEEQYVAASPFPVTVVPARRRG